MALLRKFFYRKPPDGLLQISDRVYDLLHLLAPLNPIPSQLRYLQYVSRRNLVSQWPPLDRALSLDCIIIRLIPNIDGEGGCRPIFRIYGQDPSLFGDRSPKILFSTPKRSKAVRHYKQVLKEFLSCAEGEVRSFASLYSEVGRNVDALILYFGEDPARCPFEQVISTMLNFVRMFNQAREENCKQLEFERKKAEKEAAAEKLKRFRKWK